MHIKDIDLNLLRLFDAVYRTRSVSRAADLLDLTQPAASQALTRLRLLIKDPLFVRAGVGVQPTPKADRLANAVRSALGLLEEALNESALFDPLQSRKVFRIHMSDIGEGRFLPDLMVALQRQAPGVIGQGADRFGGGMIRLRFRHYTARRGPWRSGHSAPRPAATRQSPGHPDRA